MSFNNFTGAVTVYGLSVRIGSPSISSNKQCIEVPYIGVSDPDSATVSMVKYQYSLDNGVTYLDMTPVSSADTTNISFSSSGTNLKFNWDAKKDIGSNLYNTNIRVVLQASEFGLNSSEATRSFVFPRSSTNIEEEKARKAFPDTYEGISGGDYVKSKLPRSR